MLLLFRSVFFTFLSLAISLSGCAKDEKSGPAGEPPPSSGIIQAPAGSRSLQIVPEAPTVADNLQSIYSGGGLKVSYRWERDNQVIEGATGPMLPRGSFARGDTVSLTVTVDGQELSASALIGNSLPKVLSVSFNPPSIYGGLSITAIPAAVDADGDSLRFAYQWAVNGENLAESGPLLPGNQFRRGDSILVTVTPSDDEGSGSPFTSLTVTVGNAPPRFTSIPVLEFKSDTYEYYASAEDPDGDAITYSLSSAPRGMTIDPGSGKITWPIGGKADAGTHTIGVVARDSAGIAAVQKYTLAVTIPE